MMNSAFMIPLSGQQFEAPDLIRTQANAFALRNAQQAFEANQFDLQQKREADARERKAREALIAYHRAGRGEQNLNLLYGSPEAFNEERKGLLEEATKRANTRHLDAGTAKLGLDAQAEQQKMQLARQSNFANQVSALAQQPGLSLDMVKQHIEQGIQSGMYDAKAVNAVPMLSPDPNMLRQQLNAMSQAAMSASERGQLLEHKIDRESREKIANAQLAETARGHNLSYSAQMAQVAKGQLHFDPERGVVVNLQTGEVTEPTTSGGKKLSPKSEKMDAAQKKELMSIDASMATMKDAQAKIKANPSAFGFLRGFGTELPLVGGVAETVQNKLSTGDEIKARGAVFRDVSSAIHELIGAAQSERERTQLRSFMPDPKDDARVLGDKLQGAMEWAAVRRKVYAQPAGAAQVDASPNAPGGGPVDFGAAFGGKPGVIKWGQ